METDMITQPAAARIGAGQPILRRKDTAKCPMTTPDPSADNAPKDTPPPQQTLSTSTPSPALSETLPSQPALTDRSQLLDRASTFLAAPEIRSQDSPEKRAFLADKGLTDGEIDILLRKLPPPVPPRTYPPLPPSALPTLLIGLAKMLTWLTGSSAIILLIYHRYLLPRLTRNYQARHALHSHASMLLKRLASSSAALQAAQIASYAGLPRALPPAHREQFPFVEFETLDDVLEHAHRSAEPTSHNLSRPSSPSTASPPNEDVVPDLTILRCALHEVAQAQTGTTSDPGDNGISTEALFAHLERRLPWLSSEHEQGAERQAELWAFLTSCPLFTSSSSTLSGAGSSQPADHPSRLLWKYTPPTTQPAPLLESITRLGRALPSTYKDTIVTPSAAAPDANDVLRGLPASLATTPNPRQRTLEVLSDLTGYITSQMYTFGSVHLSYLVSSARGKVIKAGELAVEDEIRREIRALKGLVLNRRTFLPPNNEIGINTVGVGGNSVRPLNGS